MRNKRGFLVWSNVVEIVIGAIVLGLIIFAVYPDAFSSSKKLLNNTRADFTGKTKFTPYKAVFTAEEHIIDDSMNALMCAFSSVAKGSVDPSWCLGSKTPDKDESSDSEKASCEGVLFGTDKCVNCEVTPTLPLGTKIVDNAASITDAMRSCLRKHNRISNPVLCARLTFAPWKRELLSKRIELDTARVSEELGDEIAELSALTASLDALLKEEEKISEELATEFQFPEIASERKARLVEIERERKDAVQRIEILEPLVDSRKQRIFKENSVAVLELPSSRFFTSQLLFTDSDRQLGLKKDHISFDMHYVSDKNQLDSRSYGREIYLILQKGNRFVFTDKNLPQNVEQRGAVCTLSGFELPQDTSKLSNYIPNLGDPEYLVYYEKFPEKEKASWQTHDFFWINVGLVVQGVFAFVPAIGPAVKALRGTKAAGEAAAGALAKAANSVDNFDEAGELLAKTKNLGKSGGVVGKTISQVAESVSDASPYLAKEQLKKIDDAVDFVFDAYKRQGKSSKTWVKDDLLNVAISTKHGTKKKGLDAMETILRGELQRAGFGNDIIDGTVKRVIGKLTDATRKTYISKHALKQTMKEVTEGVSNKRAAEALELIIKRNNAEAFSEVLFKSGHWDDTIETLQKQFATFDDIGGITLSKRLRSSDEVLKQMWTKDLTGLSQADEVAAKAIIGNLDESAKGIWNSKFVTAVKSNTKSADEFRLAGTLWAKNSAKSIGNCITVGGFIIAAGVASQFISDGTVAVGAGVGAATLLIKGTPFSWVFNGPFRSATGCMKFLRYNYLPVAIGFGMLYNLEESRNQAFVPMGPNTIGVAKPKPYKIPPKPYDPVGIENLYLTMNKDPSQPPERFFMASPCKADLLIAKNYCSCQMNDGDFGYYFSGEDGKGNRIQPIEAIGVEKTVETVWDTFSAEEKKEYLTVKDWSFKKTVSQRYGLESRINQLLPKNRFLEKDPLVLERTELFKFLFPDAETFVMMMGHVLFSGSVNHVGTPYGKNDKIEFLLELTPLLDLDEVRFRRFLEVFSSNFVSDLTSVSIVSGELSLDDWDKEELAHLVRGLFYENPKIETESGWFYIDSFDLPQTFKSVWRLPFSKRFWKNPREKPSDVLEINWDLMRNTERHERLNNIFSHRGPIEDPTSLTYLYSSPDETFVFSKIQLEWYRLQDRRERNLPLFLNSPANNYGNLVWFKSTSKLIYKMQMKRFLKSDYLDDLIKDILPRNYIVAQPTAEQVNAVKVCRETDVVQTFVPTKTNRFSGSRRVTIPCVSATPRLDSYSNWNEGNNFCYTGRNLNLEYATTAANVAAIIAAVALIPISGGTSAGAVVTLAVSGVELGAVAGSYALQKCGAWPRHIPSVSACFGGTGDTSRDSKEIQEWQKSGWGTLSIGKT